MKKFTLFLLFIITTSLYAAPEQKSYQVNLIIFSQISPDSLKSEHFPNRLKTPNLKNTLDILNPTTTSSDYKLLPGDQLGLQDELKKLSNDSNKKVLLKMAWTQPMSTTSKAQWIQLYGGQAYDSSGQPITVGETLPDEMTGSLPPGSMQKPAYWELNGKIKVSFQNFYRVYAQLYLTEPESIISGTSDQKTIGDFQPIPLRTFIATANRHTRLNQLNYIDHPLFGMLVKITPASN